MGDKHNDSNERVEMDDLTLEPEDELEPGDKLAKLKKKLKACEAESKANLDGWQRAQADLVNARKAAHERVERAREAGIEHIVEELSVVLDSFAMAMQGKGWESLDPTWKTGISQIRDRFVMVLTDNGLSIDDPTGHLFDPERHECVQITHVEDPAQDHTVITTLQQGIRMGERVIRPAKVVVGSNEPTDA